MTEYGRRDFLAMSALGVLGAAGVFRSGKASADEQLLYVGTYTENNRTDGIYLVHMNSRTGDLRLESAMNAGANPSFLAIHPNGHTLYVVNETAEHNGKPGGGVSAFAIASETGALTRLNDQSSGGAGPCYVSVDRRGRVVLVANYDGGSVAVLPIDTSGGLGAATHVEQHQGKGPNVERQEAPHAHCIVSDPSSRFALAVDLGIDRVRVYRLDDERGVLHHVDGADAVLRAGAGPRHIVFHPTLPLVFVANELNSTVSTLQLDRERGDLKVIDSSSTLPKGWTGENFPADIHIDPLGSVVYVSNRGHNTIAVFSVAKRTGALALRQVIPTEGDWPRNFALDPTGRWLLVANQRSGSVVVLARDPKSGLLTSTKQQLQIPNPACVRFRARE